MLEDRSHTFLAMSRQQLTLTIRTLVMRDLVRHRGHLIRRYLRQHGMKENWGTFLCHGTLVHRRAIRELLAHDPAHRPLVKAKAELDGILSQQTYAECTAPLWSRELHQTALRLVSRRLTFAADQLKDSPDEYGRELWEEQQDYYRELQTILHTQCYDSAVPVR
jgi:hypothetical protein